MSTLLSRIIAPRSSRDSGCCILNSYLIYLLRSFFSSFSGVCVCVGCSRTWDGQFTLTLQESSVGVDELVRLDIANGDTGHDCGKCWRSVGVCGVVWIGVDGVVVHSAIASGVRRVSHTTTFRCAEFELVGCSRSRRNFLPRLPSHQSIM